MNTSKQQNNRELIMTTTDFFKMSTGRTFNLMLLVVLLTYLQQSSHAFLNVPRSTSPLPLDNVERNCFIQRNLKLSPLYMAADVVRTKLEERWFPQEALVGSGDNDDDDDEDSRRLLLETKSLEYMSDILVNHMKRYDGKGRQVSHDDPIGDNLALTMVKGKFQDLCCTIRGETLLEKLFEKSQEDDPLVVQGAIMSLQSLLILGTQYGVKATPEQFERSVSHLVDDGDDPKNNFSEWDPSDTRRLKYESNRTAGLQLLAQLGRRRSAQGAFDLLVRIGAWEKHEDLALLRSGFSIRFSKEEVEAAEKACLNNRDPDTLLGIRQDFRKQKVYTIDGAATTEIDDGLGVEVITKPDGSKSNRFWIHIADADRWAPRDSKIFEVAKRRATSLYLPHGSVPMMPSQISSDMMSLKANQDVCALSLGVELADDGSVIDSSIVMAPSQVRVTYRLTYDDVDEMLEDGIAYSEESELGSLYSAALLRRKFREGNGSAESFVPTQIPQFSMSTFPDKNALDDTGIALNIQVSHNGGKNQSSTSEVINGTPLSYAAPVSAASMLVTEMMILAGEAIGKWQMEQDKIEEKRGMSARNSLRLPFRTQPKPDYRSRMREKSIMDDLLSNNIGGGYCHAWFARRFLLPVKITEDPSSHSGLGIDCYVQWSSPIRRFGDLQVHCSVKRYLRRQKLIEMLRDGSPVPDDLTSSDIGCEMAELEAISHPSSDTNNDDDDDDDDVSFDTDIDYNDRGAFINAARILQRTSQRYWMLEYVSRLDSNKIFQALVLGCTNPARRQYALYIPELGLEWRYNSPGVSLQAGVMINVKVGNALPRNGQMTFVRVST